MFNYGLGRFAAAKGLQLTPRGLGYARRYLWPLHGLGQGTFPATSDPLADPYTATINTSGVTLPSIDTSSVSSLLTAGATAYTQAQVLDINKQRLAAGLQPLSPSALGVGVSVGLSPDLTNLLIYGGLAALALYALK